MMAVALDTNVFAYAAEEPRSSDERSQQIHRDSKALVDKLINSGEDVIVPSVVIAELMSTTMCREERDELAWKLEQEDVVKNLDFAASLLVGEITCTLQKLGLWPKKSKQKDEKDWTRCDCMIAAIAYYHRADTIYTYNMKDFEPINEALVRMKLKPFKLLEPPPAPITTPALTIVLTDTDGNDLTKTK